MHRKKKRDPNRVAPKKSEHALRYVDSNGQLIRKTTTYVTPEMRQENKLVKENW